VSLPPNFGRAVDLSSLGKPAVTKPSATLGKEVTASTLASDFVTLSKTKVVILLCWSARSAESVAVLETLAKIHSEAADVWTLGSVDVDAQPEVAKALQVRAVPFAVGLVGEQLLPLFEQSYPEAQIRMVIEKVLSIAAEQGIGEAVEEKMEPEEEEALAALESHDYDTAESAYKKLLARRPADIFAKLGLAHTQLLIRTTGLDAEAVAKKAAEEPGNLDAQIQCADCEVVLGKIDLAFDRLLNSVRTSTGADQARVKNHLLELFALVDPADPRLIKARSALANALF
jgi:putative thioredoxin